MFGTMQKRNGCRTVEPKLCRSREEGFHQRALASSAGIRHARHYFHTKDRFPFHLPFGIECGSVCA